MKLIYDKDFLSFTITQHGKTLIEGGHMQVANYIKQNDVMKMTCFLASIKAMEKNGHDISEHGDLFGGFMYTLDSNET